MAFLAGFVTDFLLLDRVDDTFDNAILFLYVSLATLGLIAFYAAVAERVYPRLGQWLLRVTPGLMQYAFGGLLSGMLIFYGRSGDLVANAPFLLLIVTVIVLNELVTKRSERLLYNIGVYFIGVFSWSALMVPVWLGVMGDAVFVGSGLLAVAITMGVIKVLKWIIPNFLTLQKRLMVFIIGTLYAVFNIFYFLNIIPPIPLSLTELGIYQIVNRDESTKTYTITTEKSSWYERLPGIPRTITPSPEGRIACFARVYAPTKLHTGIVMHWQYLDTTGVWQTRHKERYDITGENPNGYGGYATVGPVGAGVWRCGVESERGQVLGRTRVEVVTDRPARATVTFTK